jgi:hypothetical protein
MIIVINATTIDVAEEVWNEQTQKAETLSYQVVEPSEPIDYTRAKKVESIGDKYYVEY